jgi:hypothetical protein
MTNVNFDEVGEYSPFLWTITNVVLSDGTWDFTERKWQIAIMDDPHPRIVSKKSAQVGETMAFICKALWFMHHRRVRVIWTFPRQDDVSEFVPTRFLPLLSGSPRLARYVGREREDPRSQRITKYKDSYIYFQEASVEPRQTPADMVANDEVDRSNLDYLDAFTGRMENSKYKFHYRFSTPTIPGIGIDKMFNDESDQRLWHVRCEHCNYWQSLNWDNNFMIAKDSTPYYGCSKCKRVLSPETIIDGEYVPMFPSRTVHGYHVSGMMLPLSKPPALMYERFKSTHPKNFYNLVLGETYQQSGKRYDSDIILDACMPEDEPSYPHQNRADGATYLGVDQKLVLHAVVAQAILDPNTNRTVMRVIHAEKIEYREGRQQWRRLAELMRLYNIRMAVIDGVPEQVLAMDFRNAFPGKVALKYDPPAMTDLYRYDETEGKLLLERNLNFDGMLDDIHNGLWRFYGPRRPLDPMVAELIAHLSNLKREEVSRDRRDGSTVSVGVWRHSGADDFAHAMGYARIARILRPDNRLQATLIGQVANIDNDEAGQEMTESMVWKGLKRPGKAKRTVILE